MSKRSELFAPNQWPSYYKKAKGVEVEDIDGNTYIDMYGMGIGSCILGYADDEVNEAVKNAVDAGSMCLLNAPEEVELAELFCQIHPWAGMVRYTRGGGEAMAVAVRIARAYSGKEKVAFCGYHGWHDWYIAANLADDKNLDGHLLPGLDSRGIPRGLKGTSIPFQYNRIEELEKIVAEHEIGVIVVEPFRLQEPKDNFLEKIREIADRIGAVLVFDEITIGWRVVVGGVHLRYGVNPDIAVFAKGTSNGFAMGVVIGKEEVMQAAQFTFISSSYWTERIGPVAALATIRKMLRENIPQYLDRIGTLFAAAVREAALKHGLEVQMEGLPGLLHFSFSYEEKSQAIRTLFTQEMLKRGILASGGLYTSFAHKEEHIERYRKALDEVFPLLKTAIDGNRVQETLEGPVAHSGFKRLT